MPALKKADIEKLRDLLAKARLVYKRSPEKSLKLMLKFKRIAKDQPKLLNLVDNVINELKNDL